MNGSAQTAVDRILATSKYGVVDRSVIERIVAEAERRYGTKRATDEAKRLLHQVWGMYYGGAKLGLAGVGDLETSLRLHQSTQERLPILREFYDRIFAVTGEPGSIVDYACGLNPLAYASLGFSFPVQYRAFDIDSYTVGTLNGWFDRLNLSGRYTAHIGDLVADNPEAADVALLLKVLPVLELQVKGISRTILDKQLARTIVVSYPVRSVSGKEKGMAKFYRKQFYDFMSGSTWQLHELLFQSELVFILRR